MAISMIDETEEPWFSDSQLSIIIVFVSIKDDIFILYKLFVFTMESPFLLFY